jgi:ferrochelatase
VLNRDDDGTTYRVAIGMRHAPPFIADGLGDLVRAGVRRVVALVMSPQYSATIMGGYLRALEAAREALGSNGAASNIPVVVAEAWNDEPRFITAMAERVREALARFPEPERATVPVLFTAHSLPRSVADGEPGYIRQLQDTAQAIAAAAALPATRWQFAYQSAGHTPEPWLTPDVKDLLPHLYRAGYRSVLVAPVQFLADHLEVLYDIDVAAREEAEVQGMRLVRTASLNVMPMFIEALAGVVRRTV